MLILTVVALVLLATIPRLRRLASRPLRLATLILAPTAAVLFLAVAGLLFFFNASYTRHLATVAAPDGRHVAIPTYIVNDGTGVDTAEVSVRHAFDPYAHRVYTGPVHFDPAQSPPEPELQWVDDTHLLIRYHTWLYPNGTSVAREQGCAAEAEGVSIRCEEIRVHAVR